MLTVGNDKDPRRCKQTQGTDRLGPHIWPQVNSWISSPGCALSGERVTMHDTLRVQSTLEPDEIKNMVMEADQQKKALGYGLVSNFREGHNCWRALSRWGLDFKTRAPHFWGEETDLPPVLQDLHVADQIHIGHDTAFPRNILNRNFWRVCLLLLECCFKERK